MLENQPARLKSPWSTPRAQGILGLVMGLTFSAQALSHGTLNWLRGMELAAGLTLLIVALHTLTVGARTRESTPPDFSGPWVQDGKRILATGDKIGAIKAVRLATNLGLAEAKGIVETWEHDQRQQN